MNAIICCNVLKDLRMDNAEMVLKGMVCEEVEWIQVAQDRVQ